MISMGIKLAVQEDTSYSVFTFTLHYSSLETTDDTYYSLKAVIFC